MVRKSKVEKIINQPSLEVKTNLSCIGSICFNSDGTITVKVPKTASLECAQRTTKSILAGKEVSFEIEARDD